MMNRMQIAIFSAVVFATGIGSPDSAAAHCDGMDGPVVKAARKALDSGNVSFVLIWVQKPDEAEVRKSFQKTMTVRKLGPEAEELADRYFFETVVRLHRAGEGASYTGLKPAGRDLGPAIPAADNAIKDGSAQSVRHLLNHAIQEGLDGRFKEVVAKKDFGADDIKAGREYVKAYVAFVHYVETLYRAAHNPAHGHYPDGKSIEDHTKGNHEKKGSKRE